MGFKLRIKNPPSGAVRWWAEYSAGNIYSGWLDIGATWDCPHGAYGKTDLRIMIANAAWDIIHDKKNLGPIHDNTHYAYNCATQQLEIEWEQPTETVRLFLANPPPGAATWRPGFMVKQNDHYVAVGPVGRFPMDQVIDIELPSPVPPVNLQVFLFRPDGSIWARQSISDFTITGGTYGYEWYSGKLIKTDTIPPTLIRQTRYWLTVASGKTEEELKAQIGQYEAADRWRFVINTNAPASVLTAFYWLAYPQWWVFKQAVNAAGAKVEKVETVGSDIIIHVHASPALIESLIAALWIFVKFILPVIAAVFIGFIVRDIIVQKEITKQAYYAYETAKTYEDVIHYITGPSVWTCQACGYVMYYEPEKCPQCGSINIKREGGLGITDPDALQIFIDGFPYHKPETDDDRWYEKYIKYALIGGGIILGAALIVPQIVKAIAKKD